LVQVGSKHTVVLGEVVSFHVRDDLIDAQKLHVSEAWRPIGRLFGGSYSRLDNRFDLPRVALDDWKNRSQT